MQNQKPLEVKFDYYAAEGLSNSALKSLDPTQGGSPAKFKAYVLDNSYYKEASPSLENGKLIHKYVEDPKAFVVSSVTRPTDMLANWVARVYNSMNLKLKDVVDSNTNLRSKAIELKGDLYKNLKSEDKMWDTFKEGFDFLKHLIKSEDSHCLSHDQKLILEGTISSIKANSFASRLLWGPNGQNEVPLFWDMEVNGITVNCKGLADRIIIDHSQKKVILVDLKTTSKPITLYPKEFEFYRTYRQMAYYLLGMFKTIPEIKGYDVEVFIVAVETFKLYECTVYKITQEWIDRGYEEVMSLLNMYSYHSSTGNWSASLAEIQKGYITLQYNDESRR